ncbi:DUF3099 domain-containing protein [Flexivirga caeni]|uniref:DUF3099 domain-containing protein n=1 Tax=Flexivirga caeni TaxID=2294115 RepID=UPI001FE5E1D1|nr:DUF3099 domain-containing protein [Flexivirga caeni]
MPRPKDRPDVPSATDLPMPGKHDLDKRMRNYAIAMGLRTAAFVLAYLLTGPARWVCVVLACVLPEIAVIGANAANQKRKRVRGRQRPLSPRQQLHGPHP